MEIDSFLHRVQGVLKNEQRIFGSLNTFTNENEEDILKVVEAVRKTVEQEDFSEKVQRKLFVLLFLNVDSEIYNDLKKTRKLAHLVGFFPKLSRDLFMSIVLNLKMHQYTYESIASFPSLLSYQVLHACVNALGSINLFKAIDFVENLLFALFTKIVTINNDDEYSAHLKDLFQRLLLHYDAEKGGHMKKIISWKSSKLKHYAGLVMASLLSLLEKCTNVYCKKDNIAFEGDNSLYNIQVDVPAKVSPVLGVESKNLSIQQCYEHVVAKSHENFWSISIEVWLFWVEIDLDDIPDTENTLQRLVGERAYTCRESLLKAAVECGVTSKEASELVTRLEIVAIKPLTEEEKSKSLDIDDILKNVKDPTKDNVKWIHFLLKNPSFSVDSKVLDVIKPHVKLIYNGDALKLVDVLFTHIQSNEDCFHHKNFILEAVKSLSVECQTQVCDMFVKKFGSAKIMKKEDFQSVLIETFNKVINEEDKEKELFPEFVSLALQDAEEVVAQAVAEGVTSEVRGQLMADLLGRLQPFCDLSRPQDSGKVLLVSALEKLLLSLPNLPESQQTFFPQFVGKLVKQNTLKGEGFLTDCILENLHIHLESKNWIVLLASLETIAELFYIDCRPACLATLALLVNVLQCSRWSPNTFTMSAVRVCELTQLLIKQFVAKWFHSGCKDDGVANVVKLLEQQVCALDRYHLSRLLGKEQLPEDPALQLIHRMHYGVGKWSVLQVPADHKLHLVYSLCFVLPLLTGAEWTELFCVVAPRRAEFLCLFHIVCDSLLLCLDSAKVKSDPKVLGCLHYAITNVAEFVKCELMSWMKSEKESRISVLEHFCQLISHLPEPQQETLGGSVIKVLMQLLPECSRREPLSADQMTRVTTAIALLQAPLTRQALAKEFLEMVHQ